MKFLCAGLLLSLIFAGEAHALRGFSLTEENHYVKNRDYHFGFGVAKFSAIGNEYNHYEKLFSSPSLYPTFWVERSVLALPYGIDLSAGLRFGYYSDTGKSARPLGANSIGENGLERDLSDDEIDNTQESNLRMIPIDFVLNASISPFSGRWIALNFWAGIGYNFIENSTKADLPDDVDQGNVTPFVNSGWNQETVSGFSFSIDVTKLDSISAYSLRVYGIESLFITPFVQMVTTTDDKLGTYDRDMYGLMFTFETWR